MSKFQQGFTCPAPQTKDQLRKMLADAVRNTDHIEPVVVPPNKRSLPTRQKAVAVPETSEPTVATSAKQPTNQGAEKAWIDRIRDSPSGLYS